MGSGGHFTLGMVETCIERPEKMNPSGESMRRRRNRPEIVVDTNARGVQRMNSSSPSEKRTTAQIFDGGVPVGTPATPARSDPSRSEKSMNSPIMSSGDSERREFDRLMLPAGKQMEEVGRRTFYSPHGGGETSARRGNLVKQVVKSLNPFQRSPREGQGGAISSWGDVHGDVAGGAPLKSPEKSSQPARRRWRRSIDYESERNMRVKDESTFPDAIDGSECRPLDAVPEEYQDGTPAYMEQHLPDRDASPRVHRGGARDFGSRAVMEFENGAAMQRRSRGMIEIAHEANLIDMLDSGACNVSGSLSENSGSGTLPSTTGRSSLFSQVKWEDIRYRIAAERNIPSPRDAASKEEAKMQSAAMMMRMLDTLEPTRDFDCENDIEDVSLDED